MIFVLVAARPRRTLVRPLSQSIDLRTGLAYHPAARVTSKIANPDLDDGVGGVSTSARRGSTP
jgi:hypothetical protein